MTTAYTNSATYIESLRQRLAEAEANLTREEKVAKLIPEGFAFNRIHVHDARGALGVVQFEIRNRAELLDLVKRFPPVESYNVLGAGRSLPVPYTYMTDAVRERSTYTDIFGVVMTASRHDDYLTEVKATWYVMLGGQIVRFDAKFVVDEMVLRVQRGGRWGRGKYQRVELVNAPDSDGLVSWMGTDLSTSRSIFWRSFESFQRAMEKTTASA